MPPADERQSMADYPRNAPYRRIGAPRSPVCLYGTPSADDLVLYVEAGGCRRPYGSMKVNLGGVGNGKSFS